MSFPSVLKEQFTCKTLFSLSKIYNKKSGMLEHEFHLYKQEKDFMLWSKSSFNRTRQSNFHCI